MKVDGDKILKFWERYQKFFETTTINQTAYKTNNSLYFLCFYERKWSGKLKAHAIITPDLENRDDALSRASLLLIMH